MTGDSGERLPDTPRVDLSMPKVVDIQTRPTTLEARPLRNFASSVPRGGDAIEFIVKTDAPIPIRALGPALYVGETPVTEVTQIGPNTYRFVAATSVNLAQDAAIRLSWTGKPPAQEEPAEFRFSR